MFSHVFLEKSFSGKPFLTTKALETGVMVGQLPQYVITQFGSVRQERAAKRASEELDPGMMRHVVSQVYFLLEFPSTAPP